jgi:hypothetical protein
MPINEKRRKRARELYFNYGRTTHEIAKTERMSIRDISSILKEEESKQQKYKQHEMSTKAYKLFSKKKSTVDVAIELNLSEPEVSKTLIEYCRLKKLDKLNSIFKETNGKLSPFLKLYKLLIRQRGMSIENVVNAVDIDIHKLPYMESLYRQAKDEVDKMQRTRQETENYLHTLNDEIASSKELLQSCRISCQHKRQEAENLNNEISRLESVVTRFKSNNEEYLKIQKMVEEVSKFLADGKVLLQFALASIIEAIRRNPDKYNNLLVCNISSSSTSTPAQDSLVSPIEAYKDLILDEAKRLYDKLLNHFTNSIIDNAAGASSSSSDPILSSTFPNLSNQSYTYRIEESEGFHNSKGDIAD